MGMFGRRVFCNLRTCKNALPDYQQTCLGLSNFQCTRNLGFWNLKRNRYSSGVKIKHIVKSPLGDVEIPNENLTKFIWKDFTKWQNSMAVKCGLTGRSYSYKDARKLGQKIAAGLIEAGFRPGQVIACLLPNTLEYPLLVMGALEAGLVISPINPIYTRDEVVHQLKDCGAVALVTFPDKSTLAHEAIKELKKFNKHQSETIRLVVMPGPDGIERTHADAISFSDLTSENIDIQNLEYNMSARISSEDLAFLPYSSGTTGLPKGVCLTHRNIISNLVALAHPEMRHSRQNDGSFQEVVPLILPIFHIYGLVVVTFLSLINGSKLITLPKFEEKSFLRVLKEEKPTLLYTATPLILYMGSSPNVTKEHLESVHCTMSGAAPVGESDIQRCLHKSPKGTSYKQGYGLTECSPGVCCHSNATKLHSSVGIPLPNTEVMVIDVSTGDSLPANKNGEICVRGPQVMKCYLNNPKETEDTIDEDGWFHTGDIGYYNENNEFFIVDRVKELVKVKGFQVAPSELEEVLRAHSKILDVGVIGVPDKMKGEVPVAYLQTKENTKISKEELMAYLKEKVAPYKMVKEFFFVEAVPKLASGKILRKKLKEMYFANTKEKRE